MGTPFPSRPRLFSPSQQTPEELRRLEGVWRHTRQAQTRVPSFASSTQSAKPPPLYSDTRAPSTQVNSHSPTPIPIPTPTAPCHPSAWNPLATDHLPPKEQALKHGFVRIIHHSVELSLRDELWVLSGDGSRFSFWSTELLHAPNLSKHQALPAPTRSWLAPFFQRAPDLLSEETKKHVKRLAFLERWIASERERVIFSTITLPTPTYPPSSSLSIHSNPPHPSLTLHLHPSNPSTPTTALTLHLSLPSQTLTLEHTSKGTYIRRVLPAKEAGKTLVGVERDGWALLKGIVRARVGEHVWKSVLPR